MADKRIAWSEEMVGYGHATKEDTLNRLALVSLTVEGDLKTSSCVGSSGASLARILNGDIKLAISPSSYSTVASVLTAASAGTYVQTLTVTLITSAAAVHRWCDRILSAVSSLTTVDSEMVAPTLSTNSPTLSVGQVIFTATYDTDAGATKVYTPGDLARFIISAPNLLGYTIENVVLVDSLQ